MRNYFIGLLIVFSLLVVGCSNEEEKLAEQINNLDQLAVSYYDEGKLEKSLETYNDILALKDSVEVREKIDSIEEELKNVKVAKKFIDGLYEIEKERLRSGISVSSSDMEYIMKDIKSLIDELESLDTSADNQINKYIEEIKNGSETELYNYQYLKDEVNSDIYEDGGETDMISALDSSFDAFSSAVMAFGRNNVLDCIENILKKPFPKSYDSISN